MARTNGIRDLVQGLRIFEVCLMTGFFMAGSLFVVSALNSDSIIRLFHIWSTVFFLVLSIYAFNALSGKIPDRKNQRLISLRALSSRFYGLVTLITLILALFLGALLHHYVAIAVAFLALLWATYSAPRYGLKHIAIAGTAVHFIAQIIHFNMVWFVFAPLCFESLLWSLFFALLFTGGHLNHEMIDFDADKRAGIRTAAVWFGKKKLRDISGIIFLINFGYAIFLSFFLPELLYFGLTFSVGAFAHLIYFLALRKKLYSSLSHLRMYQTGYRLFYLAAGLGCVALRIVTA